MITAQVIAYWIQAIAHIIELMELKPFASLHVVQTKLRRVSSVFHPAQPQNNTLM